MPCIALGCAGVALGAVSRTYRHAAEAGGSLDAAFRRGAGVDRRPQLVPMPRGWCRCRSSTESVCRMAVYTWRVRCRWRSIAGPSTRSRARVCRRAGLISTARARSATTGLALATGSRTCRRRRRSCIPSRNPPTVVRDKSDDEDKPHFVRRDQSTQSRKHERHHRQRLCLLEQNLRQLAGIVSAGGSGSAQAAAQARRQHSPAATGRRCRRRSLPARRPMRIARTSRMASRQT